jgi:hypothetical protein
MPLPLDAAGARKAHEECKPKKRGLARPGRAPSPEPLVQYHAQLAADVLERLQAARWQRRMTHAKFFTYLLEIYEKEAPTVRRSSKREVATKLVPVSIKLPQSVVTRLQFSKRASGLIHSRFISLLLDMADRT